MDEPREKERARSAASFTQLMGASLLVGAAAAVLCAIAWLIARWLKL